MITIKDDSDSEMLLIEKDGECIFEGNYWDFPNYPDGILDFLVNCGIDAEKVDYVYEDE